MVIFNVNRASEIDFSCVPVTERKWCEYSHKTTSGISVKVIQWISIVPIGIPFIINTHFLDTNKKD